MTCLLGFKVEKTSYIVCTLTAGMIDHQRVELRFHEGETLSFSSLGDGDLHLTGYHLPVEENFDGVFCSLV